jgi:chaperone BCS1
MTEERLYDALGLMPHRTMLVIEDVDSVLTNKEKSKITLSTLLNALDGLTAAHGRILFLTTNHITKLPESLIRPGRIDRQVIFDYASSYQIESIVKTFFPEQPLEDVQKFVGQIKEKTVTMAEVQSHFQIFREFDRALENIGQLQRKDVKVHQKEDDKQKEDGAQKDVEM